MNRCLLKPTAADPVEVIVERDAAATNSAIVRIGGSATPVECTRVGTGAGCLRIAGKVLPFHVVRRQQTLHVWLDGETYAIEILDPRRSTRPRDAAPAAGALENLTAPMPGTILQLHVSDGDPFAAGAPLIVMESMKMEMTLSAPHPGRVKKINCKVGQMVEMGAILAQFTPPAE